MKFAMPSLLVTGIILFGAFYATDELTTTFSIAYRNMSIVNQLVTFWYGWNYTLECTCNGTQKSEPLPNINLVHLFSIVNDHRECTPNIPEKICSMLKSCERCASHKQHCSPSHVDNFRCLNCEFPCFNYTFEIKDNIFAENHTTLYPPLRRLLDTLNFCSYPKYPGTYTYEAYDWILDVWAEMQCAYGHTLTDGIYRNMSCKFLEGVWKPQLFEDCRPFVDCSLKMRRAGKIECSHDDGVSKAPTCKVWCFKGENETVPEPTLHTCDIELGWTPELPYCVEVYNKTGIELVPAPDVKLHTTRLQNSEQLESRTKTEKSMKKDLSQKTLFNLPLLQSQSYFED